MKGFYKGLVAFAFVAAATTSVAQAQGVGFHVGGGIGIPLGDFSDIASTGFHGTAGVTFSPEGLPVGVRVDGMFSRFGLNDDLGDFDANWQIISGTANAVYMFQTSEMSTFHPYLIGGLGIYNFDATGDDVSDLFESETKFGVNAGAGFNFAAGESINLFVEGRFHNVFNGGMDAEGEESNLNMVPITVGLRFGGN